MGTQWSKGRRLIDLVVDRYVNLELFYRSQEPGANGCINWTGVTSNIGYGFIGFRNTDPHTLEPIKGAGGMMTTHRLAWMIEHDRLPYLRNINHSCHNKLCVNKDHLIEGTQTQKLADMARDGIKTGREAGAVYPYNHQQYGRVYKYSIDEIQWIRLASTHEIKQKYNVTRDKASHMRWAFRHGYKWLPFNIE